MRGNHSHRGNHHNHNNQNNNNGPRLTKLFIKGWTNSNAASNNDGGVQALSQWLEKKSTRKIIKSYRNNDIFTISVNPDDAQRFIHMNGFTFAGAQISIEQSNSNQNNNQNNQNQSNQNSNNHNNQNNQNTRGGKTGGRGGNQSKGDSMQVEKDNTEIEKVEAALISVIQRGYEAGPKFLNLSGLPAAAELQATGLTSQSASKVFSAIFVCCETKVFETPLKRQQMVESLSLASNGLTTVKDCIAAAGTFNHIKNLDLSNNMISDIGELRYWRNRFPNLEHIVLTNNPVASNPETKLKMKQWYPKLKFYNQEPVSDLDHTAILPKPTTAALELLPSDLHPEIRPDHPRFNPAYGQPQPGKPGDLVMKEQMALRFSYETRLNLEMTEQCLQANAFDYDAALRDLQVLFNQGKIQDSLLWSAPK